MPSTRIAGVRISLHVARQRWTISCWSLGARCTTLRRFAASHGLCCSDYALVVCEEEHLRPFTEFGQHLECRCGTLVVEVDKQVVEDDWERLRKLPELVLEPSETQRQVGRPRRCRRSARGLLALRRCSVERAGAGESPPSRAGVPPLIGG